MSTSDNHSIHKVSLKRTRQACGPCRRKKARCPGEKPVCSLCQRLGQRCAYGAPAPADRARNHRTVNGLDRGLEELGEGTKSGAASDRRLQQIEQRLEELTGLIRERLPRSNASTDSSNKSQLVINEEEALRENGRIPVVASSKGFDSGVSRSPLSPSVVESEVQVYLKNFHDQPYCVFAEDWLLNNASSLPPEIAFPLVTLTRHILLGPESRDDPIGRVCTERTWGILFDRHQTGNTGLAFLQGNFLAAQLDFAEGRADRGCSSVALGLRIIQAFGLNQGRRRIPLSESEAEARRRVTWAYFMLDRTYNASRSYCLCLPDNHFTLSFPTYTSCTAALGSLHEEPTKHGHKVDQGIVACLIRLYSLWGKATEWVFEPIVTNSLAPWQSGSTLADLESQWTQFETQFADTHRYMNVDFKRRALEEPESRSYLATWLCVQFLFHSIQCLLHHPFVTMIKLRHTKGNLSATFLQKSFETSLLHSRWIARFIKEMGEVNLRLSDPFFGYLAAIAATIQLEHTGNKNPQIALLVNNEYRTLVGYISELSSHWQNMQVLINRINELATRRQNYGSLFYNQDGFSGALSSMPTPSNLPRMSPEDEELMWDILDLTSSSNSLRTRDISDLDLGPENEALNSHQALQRSTARLAVQAEANERDQDAPKFPSRTESPSRECITSLLNHETSGDWPFVNRADHDTFASGVPDIPDWMTFGDFMAEHL